MHAVVVDVATPSGITMRRGVLPWRALAVSALVAGLVAAVAGTGFDYRPVGAEDAAAPLAAAPRPGDDDATREHRRLRRALAALEPESTYIAIDRANNRLYLRRGEQTVLTAVCSTGSGRVLRTPDRTREWVFDTPSGAFRVRSRLARPAWRKPDWAFVEEGLAVPLRAGDRIEHGVLGEYALDLGDGYLIHGTLYERLLGRSVTHGCIRLGRDDLRRVFAESRIGTPVYIF